MNVNFRCGPQRESSECSRLGWFPAFGFKEGGKGTRVFGYSLLGVTDTPIQAVPAEKEIYEGKGYIISVTSQYIIQ